MALGVAATIAPLLYFKYYGFFTVNVDERRDHARAARRPAADPGRAAGGGLVLTFMAIAYIVDIYRGDFEARELDRSVPLPVRSSRTWSPGRSFVPNELIPQLDVRRDPGTSTSQGRCG